MSSYPHMFGHTAINPVLYEVLCRFTPTCSVMTAPIWSHDKSLCHLTPTCSVIRRPITSCIASYTWEVTLILSWMSMSSKIGGPEIRKISAPLCTVCWFMGAQCNRPIVSYQEADKGKNSQKQAKSTTNRVLYKSTAAKNGAPSRDPYPVMDVDVIHDRGSRNSEKKRA